MKVISKFLERKVARQVFSSFILAALIPMIAIALFSIYRVGANLEQQNREKLEQAAKDFGTGVLGRLQLLEQYLLALSRAEARQQVVTSDVASAFAGITIVEVNGAAVNVLRSVARLPAISPDERKYLNNGKTQLIIGTARNGHPEIYLLRYLKNNDARESILVAMVNPEFLWGDREALPYQTDFCVLASGQTPLFCSTELPYAAIAQWRANSVRGAKSEFTWRNGEAHLAVSRNLFLRAAFNVSDFSVLATIRESDALGPLTAFKQNFMLSIGLAICLACILALSQIRRIMTPLEKLISATRRIGSNQFGMKVEIDRKDEFGELANAFNTMAQQLGHQFNALTVFSEIDRFMLSRKDIDAIVEMMLDRLPNIIGVDIASVTVVDSDNRSAGKTYVRVYCEERPLAIHRVIISDDESDELLCNLTGFWTQGKRVADVVPIEMRQLGVKTIFKLPIVWDQKLCGVLQLGYFESPNSSHSNEKQIRDFADRLGVALSAATRDELLYRNAHFDSLTGLPNRVLFRDRLSEEIERANYEDTKLAVLFVDLDRFKLVNDTLGHASGDDLLQQAARRLSACVRKSDTLARLGGDEFTVILPRIATVRDAETVASIISAALAKPFDIGGLQHFLGASIGISVFPRDGTSASELLKNADTAMYRAKDEGGGAHVNFEARMNVEASAKVALERELRRALENNEFIAYFQPQLDLATGAMSGMETLVRWNHPQRGILTPIHFIDCAEDTGLIVELGAQVLAMACANYDVLRQAGIAPPHISVNVSGHQFKDDNLLQHVGSLIARYRLPPGCLELEITESVIMSDKIGLEQSLESLRVLGVRLSIDDFGTGYSSMAYLKRLPVDLVKIDRSFIVDVATNRDSRAIVAAIIAMGHTLKKEIIAEGVETPEQQETLIALHCDHLQGYLYSRPMGTDDFTQFCIAEQTRAQQAALAA